MEAGQYNFLFLRKLRLSGSSSSLVKDDLTTLEHHIDLDPADLVDDLTVDTDDLKPKNFKEALIMDQSLEFFSPRILNGELVVAPPPKAFEKGEIRWQNAVVIQFFDNPPNFNYFQRMENILRGRDGKVEVSLLDSGMFLVQLPSLQARDRVLDSDSRHIQSKPMLDYSYLDSL